MHYAGYCYYTVSNTTWGGDARRRLWSLNGCQANVRLPRNDGNGHLPLSLVCLFPTKEAYIQFADRLKKDNLACFVKLQEYRELPDTALVMWTDREERENYEDWLKELLKEE